MTEQTRQVKLFIPSLIIFGLISVTGCNSKTEPAASAPNQATETPASTSAPEAAATPKNLLQGKNPVKRKPNQAANRNVKL